jgi:hypothetical protein
MHLPDMNRPMPAAIDGRRWTVAGSPGDLAGATDTKKANLFAPLSDTPTARLVRNHELGHARLTPRMSADALCKRHGVTMEAIQWSEDSRIGAFLDRADLVDRDAITETEADMIAQVCGGSDRTIAGAFLVNWFQPYQRARLFNAFARRGVDSGVLDGIEARIECMIETQKERLSRGRGRRRRSGPSPFVKAIRTQAGFKSWTVPLAQAFDFEFPPGTDGGNSRQPGDLEAARKLRTIKARGAWYPLSDVHTLKTTRSIRPRRAPARRWSDAGVIPSAVHRLPVDGAIFASKRRVKGGTVLCDASGSMHYSDDDIERLILEAPGATIAFYAGSQGRKLGRIVVAGSKGRAATVADVRRALPGGDNLVDGPALRWLARQPAPRFWISDEGVGGVTDFGIGSESHAECRAICRAAGIKIIPHVDALRR